MHLLHAPAKLYLCTIHFILQWLNLHSRSLNFKYFLTYFLRYLYHPKRTANRLIEIQQQLINFTVRRKKMEKS